MIIINVIVSKKTYLTVGNSLFRQIIINNQSVFAVVSEVFTHGATRVGSEILQGSGIRGGSRYDDGIFNGISVGQTFKNLSDSGPLLTNGDVDAVQLLFLVVGVVETFLVDDGINGQSSFTVIEIIC